MGCARHEEGRDEHCENAQHRHESRQRRLGGSFARRSGEAAAMSKMSVDVLDGDRRLVDQDADRQRQPAQGHDVDCLTRHP